jgi:hypothetical protein
MVSFRNNGYNKWRETKNNSIYEEISGYMAMKFIMFTENISDIYKLISKIINVN